MRFLVDAQLPPALARWLAEQGHQAEHVADINLAAAPDGAIWRRAEQLGAVLLTKDEDFAIWHDMRGPTALSVVWIRIGNTRKAELIRQVEKLLPMIIERLEHRETLIEVR